MRRCIFVFLTIVLCLPAVQGQQFVPGRYIVELSSEPLGPAARSEAATVLAQRTQISAEQLRVRTQIERLNGAVVGAIQNVGNALFVSIPEAQSASMAAIPGVRQVYQVRVSHMTLDHALPLHQVPDGWVRIGGMDKAGAGVKIAMIDTGISPESPAFADSTLKIPVGYPKASSDANMAFTTNKIIVARSYEDIYQETAPDDVRDRNGHGTETAMCAAGVTNRGPLGTITGVAPKAWIGAYKIVQGNGGSASEDVVLKAWDDALADGMDVINYSFGDTFPPDDLTTSAINRLTSSGVIFVTSNGNSGPGLNTVGEAAAVTSAISVGATYNDRFFANAITGPGGINALGYRSTGAPPSAPVSGTVFDVSTVDTSGLLCSPLPNGSATGKIALIMRGTCTFESKANNAQAGGAIAAVVFNAPNSPPIGTPSTGAATLPLILIGNADGTAIQKAVAADASAIISMNFADLPYPQDPIRLATFTSRGPVFDPNSFAASLKPDLIATGTDLYMATQKLDPTGELYNKDGYITAQGTSFSSPLVAGAAAVLRAYLPGLTVDQYRSMLINTATPLLSPTQDALSVQLAGAGRLNLDGALAAPAAALPTSLSFGIGQGTLGGASTEDFNQITLTNVTNIRRAYSVYPVPFDFAPPLQFSAIPFDNNPASTLTITLEPHATTTFYAYWTTANPLPGGQYQGDVVVEPTDPGAGYSLYIPYWYGVPTFSAASLFSLNSLPASAKAGSSVPLFVRVTDDIGFPLTTAKELRFNSQVVSGAGSIALSSTVFVTGILEIVLKLDPNPGSNTFVFQFANLRPVSVSITGK